MHILLLINKLGLGGAERVVTDIYNLYRLEQRDVYLAVLDRGSIENMPHPDLILDNGTFNILRPLLVPLNILRLYMYCKRHSISTIQAHLYRSSYFAIIVGKLLRCKVQVFNHSNAVQYYGGLGLKGKVNLFLIRKLFPLATSVISVSEYCRQDLKQILPKHPDHRVIYGYSIPGAQYRPKISFQRKNPGQICLCTVGRLSKEKCIDFIIRLMLYLPENFRLTIIGDGPLRAELSALVIDLKLKDRVVFTGFQANTIYFIEKSDLYISASESESFGLAILESLSLGVPVISYDSGGPREIITNGMNGFLIDQLRLELFADKIKYLMHDNYTYRRFQRNALNIIKRFSREKTHSNYLELLKNTNDTISK